MKSYFFCWFLSWGILPRFSILGGIKLLSISHLALSLETTDMNKTRLWFLIVGLCKMHWGLFLFEWAIGGVKGDAVTASMAQLWQGGWTARDLKHIPIWFFWCFGEAKICNLRWLLCIQVVNGNRYVGIRRAGDWYCCIKNGCTGSQANVLDLCFGFMWIQLLYMQESGLCR